MFVVFADNLRHPLGRTLVVFNCSFRFRSLSMFFDWFLCYDFICGVCSVVLFNVRPCLYPSLRGRPRTVSSVRARTQSASDTDKIYSIVLRDSKPLYNQQNAWPFCQVQGTHRADREPQGFARPQAANQHRHIVERFLRFLVLDARLQEPDAEDRATVGTDPSATSGLGEE